MSKERQPEPVKKQHISSDPFALGDVPGDLSVIPGDREVPLDLDLTDPRQRRNFRRRKKQAEIIEKARSKGQDVLAFPKIYMEQESARKTARILFGVGLAAGVIIGGVVIYDHRKSRKK